MEMASVYSVNYRCVFICLYNTLFEAEINADSYLQCS